MPHYNGILVLWPECVEQPDCAMASDMCLTGLGGTYQECEYFHLRVPSEWKGRNIAYLEMWGVIVALKVLGHRCEGKRIVMYCDNESVVRVLSSGKARDEFLQNAMREVVFLLARKRVKLRVKYLRGWITDCQIYSVGGVKVLYTRKGSMRPLERDHGNRSDQV